MSLNLVSNLRTTCFPAPLASSCILGLSRTLSLALLSPSSYTGAYIGSTLLITALSRYLSWECSYRSYYVCRGQSCCGDGAPHGQPAPAAAAAAAGAAAAAAAGNVRTEGPPASRHAGSVVVVDPRPHARPPHGERPVITARHGLRRRGRLLAAAWWWWLL